MIARATRRRVAFAVVAGAAAAVIIACSADALEGGNPAARIDAAADGPPTDAPPPRDAGVPPQPDDVFLVHAASFPPFRVCFTGIGETPPLPTDTVMPRSNLVGVDIGVAVRLGPLEGTLGDAYVFPEASIRDLYTDNGPRPTCKTLLSGSAGASGVYAGGLGAGFEHGVHVLALVGCPSAAADPRGSLERCGTEWTPAKGNLAIQPTKLTPFPRVDRRLPVQIIQLSASLRAELDGGPVALGVGALDAGAPEPFFSGSLPFGKPTPNPPANVEFGPADPSDLAAFATTGIYVMRGAADGGSPSEVLRVQSLADVQRMSESRALPLSWYAAASTYVAMVVGENQPKSADGGDDDDERRRLHVLVIPLADPDPTPR